MTHNRWYHIFGLLIVVLLQVVFEGVSGSSRANGFVAIDDIAFFEGDCQSERERALHTQQLINYRCDI
jgi:hypothetical protein